MNDTANPQTEKSTTGAMERRPEATCSAPTLKRIEEIVRKDLKAICSIYPTVGNAFYDEPRERLIGRIAHSINEAQNAKDC